MKPVSMEFQASSAEEARHAAARHLQVEPANLNLDALEDGKFKATVINADAEAEFAVTEDGMQATIIASRSALGNGKPLSYDGLKAALLAAKITLPPDPAASRTLVESLAQGKAITDLVIVRGIPAKLAVHAKVEPIGDWNYPVFPGDAIGRIIAPVDGAPGTKVTGQKFDPPGGIKAQGLKLMDKGYCFIDQTALLIRAEQYGIVHFKNQEMFIKPLISISRDAMSATTPIYPRDFKAMPITPERMQLAMQAMELMEKLERKAFDKGVAEAEEHNRPVMDVVICRGSPPRHGKNGWFEMIFQEEDSRIGEISENGRIDYRARGIIRAVKQGDILGRLHDPEPGIPGKDVYGKILVGHDGIPYRLSPEEGVVVDADGKTFIANADGLVFFIHNVLKITDVFITPGDVNMSTGNIKLEKGSLQVKGSILSGFTVSSPNNILVEEVVEDAVVEAAGDIEIRGGILMDRNGRIKAGGGVSALYAKNATITAQGDVNVTHEINNCLVFAGQSVIARKGRGKIYGSTIRCGKGVECNDLGNEMGVETTVFLGIERRSMADELKQRKELNSILEKIYAAIGSADPKTILCQAAPQKRQAVASLLKARLRAEEKLREIDTMLEQERLRVREIGNIRIKVFRTIHPGVIINCAGTTVKVTDPITYSQLYYEPGEQRIIVASL